MKRELEPEVMDDAAQARAYASADFSNVNQGFVDRVLASFPDLRAGRLVDLGCGPADIPLRLATAVPGAFVVAIDAAHTMLRLAREALAARPVARVRLLEARLPDVPLRAGSADAVISNSLLHHLPVAAMFWTEVRRLARPGAAVCVMDLFRPESRERARAIVSAAAGDADPLLQRDFFNSLLAAFTLEEVRAQLDQCGLGRLAVDVVSERHWLVSGRV